MTGADVVRAVICSLDGGYNGLEPNLQLGITPREDGAIDYTLTDAKGSVQRFVVTIEPADPEPA